MDILKECAVKFCALLDKSYFIIAGHKGKKIEIDLRFQEDHFFHLVGLHKLLDLKDFYANRNKRNILHCILNDEITYSDIQNSVYFDEIKRRLDFFAIIEEILDSNDIVIKFNQNICRSRIKAKYIIYIKRQQTYIHMFINRDESSGTYFLSSFFPRDDEMYLQRQAKYKVLYKRKNNNITNTKEVLVDRL